MEARNNLLDKKRTEEIKDRGRPSTTDSSIKKRKKIAKARGSN